MSFVRYKQVIKAYTSKIEFLSIQNLFSKYLTISFTDEDEIDEIYDNYESQGDIKFQLGQTNIKTTSRKIGDQAMWDLFEVSSI